MAQKISATTKKRLLAITGDLDDCLEALDHIESEDILELARRAAIPVSPDSFPAGSMPEMRSGSGTGSSRTETAAMAHIDGKTPRDEVMERFRKIEKSAKEARHHLRNIRGLLRHEGKVLKEKSQRPMSSPCLICVELSQDKSGYCHACYNDWHRHGKPDRLLWQMYRRGDMDDEGNLRVPECPPPSDPLHTTRGPWRMMSDTLN